MSSVTECLSKAAEFQSRAAIATDWQLKATFKDLARFHREMAKYLEQTEQSDPKKRLSVSETSSGWRVAANRAKLLSDVGLLQTDLVGACRAVPIETGA